VKRCKLFPYEIVRPVMNAPEPLVPIGDESGGEIVINRSETPVLR
jgi:hypothetical protein